MRRHAATRQFPVGPVSGQTQVQVSGGMLSSRLPTSVIGVALYRFAFRRAPCRARGSRGDCPARSSNARPGVINRRSAERRSELMASVFIGVDPHKLSATIEVLDERGERRSATGRFGTDRGGDAVMRRQVAAWPAAGVGGGGQQRRRAAAGASRPLADGEHVPRRARRSCQRGPGCSTPGTTVRPTPTTRTRSRSLRCGTRGLRVLSYDEPPTRRCGCSSTGARS